MTFFMDDKPQEEKLYEENEMSVCPKEESLSLVKQKLI
jgi:hypothetical protein